MGTDVDLLTRGAGFGYFGSTLTSLIYASFTVIFFSLEGSIMAPAFQLAFGAVCSLCCTLETDCGQACQRGGPGWFG